MERESRRRQVGREGRKIREESGEEHPVVVSKMVWVRDRPDHHYKCNLWPHFPHLIMQIIATSFLIRLNEIITTKCLAKSTLNT